MARQRHSCHSTTKSCALRRTSLYCYALLVWVVQLLWLSSFAPCQAVKIPLRNGGNGNNHHDQQNQQYDSRQGNSAPDTTADAQQAQSPATEKIQEQQQTEQEDVWYNESPAPFLTGGATLASSSSFSTLRNSIFQTLYKIWHYKPPVGGVALFTLGHLILSGRLFSMTGIGAPKNSMEAALQKQQAKRKAVGRSFLLDQDDLVAYSRYGGVDRHRQKLCSVVLLQQKQQEPEGYGSTTQQQLVASVTDALSCVGLGCRRFLVLDLIPHVAKVEALSYQLQQQQQQEQSQRQQQYRQHPSPSTTLTATTNTSRNLQEVTYIGSELAQMRAMDALLRVCRDRLLKTCTRLARTVEYWSRSLEALQRLPAWTVRKSSLERDRLRLAYAKAAYQKEVERLGWVAQHLMKRPGDLSEKVLWDVLQETELSRQETKKAVEAVKKRRKRRKERVLKTATPTTESRTATRRATTIMSGGAKVQKPKANVAKRWSRKRKNENNKNLHVPKGSTVPYPKKMVLSAMSVARRIPVPTLSRFTLSRWISYGTNRIMSIRKLDSEDSIGHEYAMSALLNDRKGEWRQQASSWTNEGRRVICQVIKESLRGASLGGGFDEAEFDKLQAQWCNVSDSSDDDEIARDWTRILEYADSLPFWRRMGEGKALRLNDAAIISWTRRINVLGLPFAFLQIGLAYWVHCYFMPRWPGLKAEIQTFVGKTLEILNQRVGIPVKGIYDEIMSGGSSLMEGFVLELEETSLDNMLRDFGYGDGSTGARAKALEDAAKQYEADMKSGMMLHLASGRLIHLLLIQMQQVKVGMLQALNYIDILMKGNQIHFQIMAAIPAALLIWYGTKLFVRTIYNIRAKDLRPISAAYVEMATYLNQLECLILLNQSENGGDLSEDDNQIEAEGDDAAPRQGPAKQVNSSSASNLGEVLLYMHRYLILLDFCSSIIPNRTSEDIQKSLQQLFSIWGKKELAVEQKQSLAHTVQLQSKLAQGGVGGPKAFRTSNHDHHNNIQWMRLVKERHERLDQYF